jgi:hypothetical protein
VGTSGSAPGTDRGGLEFWPLYHQAITEALSYHPEAHDAVERLRLELRGLQNRDLPPGHPPLPPAPLNPVTPKVKI